MSKPLTPDELKTASEVFTRTGNYAEASRAIGRETSTVRRALVRLKLPTRTEQAREAMNAGLDAGLSACQLVINRALKALSGDNPIDAKDLHYTTLSLTRAMEGIGNVQELDHKAELHSLEHEKIMAALYARAQSNDKDMVYDQILENTYDSITNPKAKRS